MPKNKTSAGLLLFRRGVDDVKVFLVHPGGPFWTAKDAGAWSIPKGEYDTDDDPLVAAKREFQEETGQTVDGEFIRLEPLRQPSGKVVSAWAVKAECDPAAVLSNTFSMEWPPRSGKTQEFPEVDRGEWFSLSEAREKILKGQVGFLDQLEALLNV